MNKYLISTWINSLIDEKNSYFLIKKYLLYKSLRIYNYYNQSGFFLFFIFYFL